MNKQETQYIRKKPQAPVVWEAEFCRDIAAGLEARFRRRSSTGHTYEEQLFQPNSSAPPH